MFSKPSSVRASGLSGWRPRRIPSALAVASPRLPSRRRSLTRRSSRLDAIFPRANRCSCCARFISAAARSPRSKATCATRSSASSAASSSSSGVALAASAELTDRAGLAEVAALVGAERTGGTRTASGDTATGSLVATEPLVLGAAVEMAQAAASASGVMTAGGAGRPPGGSIRRTSATPSPAPTSNEVAFPGPSNEVEAAAEPRRPTSGSG